MTESKHLWEANHSYSGADSNYFANFYQQEGMFNEYDSWAEFMESGSPVMDMDFNLMYRFDWIKPDEDDEYAEKEHVKFFYVQQRRGAVAADTVYVTPEDEPAVRAYLQKYADHMRDLWAPFDLSPVAE